ncbi:hypothetical protein DTO195F2_5703 [Paecilomyces variotii]|nr:hypothetical protein DTO195F2_5703 [Paecilomyces variotii]
MAAPVKVGIVSIGEMGFGIANLLSAHGYTVMTNITGRSDYTYNRARTANIRLLDSDEELVKQVDYLFSIVPPRDALATAQRFMSVKQARKSPLYYVDLNAISPRLARHIAAEFKQNVPGIKFVDGGIIGGPPRLKQSSSNEKQASEPEGDIAATWARPAIPISGPDGLANERLAKVLNTISLGADIGAASGLKCCYGSLIKGLLALSIQSFSTAYSMGVYSELHQLLEAFQPGLRNSITKMIVETPPKAGRWVDEMVEIGRCFGEEGGWDNAGGTQGADVYQRVAEVYRAVAEQTVLGKERQEHRVRGTTADDLAAAVREGLAEKK